MPNPDATTAGSQVPMPLREKLICVLIIVMVVAGGVFALNMVIDFQYKAILMNKPCELCAAQYPEMKACIYGTPIYDSRINITFGEIMNGTRI